MGNSLSFTSLAGTWKQDSRGWWFDRGNNTYPTKTWEWIDGNNDGVAECYYFDATGYLLVNTMTPDRYSVNSNGAWQVNGNVQTKRVSNKVSNTTSQNSDAYALIDAIKDSKVNSDNELLKTLVDKSKERYNFKIRLNGQDYLVFVSYKARLVRLKKGDVKIIEGSTEDERSFYCYPNTGKIVGYNHSSGVGLYQQTGVYEIIDNRLVKEYLFTSQELAVADAEYVDYGFEDTYTIERAGKEQSVTREEYNNKLEEVTNINDIKQLAYFGLSGDFYKEGSERALTDSEVLNLLYSNLE